MKKFKLFIAMVIHFIPVIGLYLIYETLQCALLDRRVSKLRGYISRKEWTIDRMIDVILLLLLSGNLYITFLTYKYLIN